MHIKAPPMENLHLSLRGRQEKKQMSGTFRNRITKWIEQGRHVYPTPIKISPSWKPIYRQSPSKHIHL